MTWIYFYGAEEPSGPVVACDGDNESSPNSDHNKSFSLFLKKNEYIEEELKNKREMMIISKTKLYLQNITFYASHKLVSETKNKCYRS